MKAKSSLPGSVPLPKIYAQMVGVLQEAMGEKPFSELLGKVWETGVEDALPVAREHGILRQMSRLGWLDGLEEAECVKRAEEIIREFSEKVDRTPAVVSILFRLYSDGMYGLFPNGICGNPPNCKACALTRICAWYNAPPSISARDKILSPAERLYTNGDEDLSDEEMLALVIDSGKTSDKSLKLSRELLSRYGSLRKLSQATATELVSYAAINKVKALRILAAFSLAERMSEEVRRKGPAVRSGKDFYDLYYQRLRDLRQEVFYVVMLDQRNRVIRDEQVSQGSLTGALVHPREVFAPAVRESAAAVALVHNHPSGDPEPSQEDKAITSRLKETANVLGIRLLDHVIIGEGSYTSFVDENLL
ncbi:MAG: DNA repair protein RadC [Planctomycetes bacterium]|nr:DNA repair protein RadC [Planctomycetota bacterium]